MSVSLRHPIPTTLRYMFRNYLRCFINNITYSKRGPQRNVLCDTEDEKLWLMTSDGFHWDGGSSVGCVVPLSGVKASDPKIVKYILDRRNELTDYFKKYPSKMDKMLQTDPEIFHIMNTSMHGKPMRERKKLIVGSNTVSYIPEFPSLLFTGSLLPPRENSLLHEHKVPSYVRTWFGTPLRSERNYDAKGGVEIHVRGDGRVYDFAYTNFTSQSFQWDYICAPFKTTDRSEKLIPVLEKLKMDDYWQKEVASLDFSKDIDVTKVNKRANQWVKDIKKKGIDPIIVNPISDGLDYDIIRIPWSHFYVRSDEKMVNHLVPLSEDQASFCLTMNNAGIGIYSDEMGDFALEILFVGTYSDDLAYSLEDPSMTIEELNKKKMQNMEVEEAWFEVEENKYEKRIVKRNKEEP